MTDLAALTGFMLFMRRLGVTALSFVLMLVTFYGLVLAVYYNRPGAYDLDREFPFFLLGWLGVACVVAGGGGLLVLYRFRSKVW